MKIFLLIVILVVIFLAVLIFANRSYEMEVKDIWQSIQTRSTETRFSSAMIANLPKPVQKYFSHAIAFDAVLATYVELEMSGSCRLQPNGQWMPMEASQIIAKSGDFVWKAKIGKGLFKLSGADYFYRDRGRVKFSLWGLIPLVDSHDDNTTRSSIGRIGGEYGLWLPSALLPQYGVTWQVKSQNIIQANLKLNNESIEITLTIDADGKLSKLSLPRWGEFEKDGSWNYIPFGGEIKTEQTFDEYTIPTQINAGWGFGQKHYFESFRVKIEQAQFV